MGIFDKIFRNKTTQKQPDHLAISLAKQFTEAVNNYNRNKAEDLAEDMILMAGRYWEKGDFNSYLHLLFAAEESGFSYMGKNYPNDLVEELIRNCKHKK